jgi:hypothetical protein
MRFVYDIKTYQKRKLQDSIAFPLEIDMGKYVQNFDERYAPGLSLSLPLLSGEIASVPTVM